MKSLNIGQRLQIVAFISIASLIILASSGAYVAHNLRTGLDYIYGNTLPSIQTIDAITEGVSELRMNVLYHMAHRETDQKIAAETRIKTLTEKIRGALVHYEKDLISDDKDKSILGKEKSALDAYLASIVQPLEHSRANDYASLWNNIDQTDAAMKRLSAAVDEHKKYNQSLAEQYLIDAEASDRRVTTLTAILVVLSLVVVGTLSFYVTREIRNRMGRLSELMNRVSDTLDFTPRVKVTRRDELGTSGEAFNKLLDHMQSSLKTISAHAESVAAAATQMAATSGQVASTSHQQADSASNMAATVEEMTVSVNHVADRAHETSLLAKESGRLASEGEQVITDTTLEIQNIAETVNQASELIHGLEENSQSISNVIQVIKEVAEQTNLLALNAAIEAARAGEQGRGFAVVADEVRKLAERTAASTQEISDTIHAMRTSAGNAVASMTTVVANVNSGVEKAQGANLSIRQIGEGARGSVGMVEEIAEAIREQGTATNAIALQVEKIAQISEESSAAAANSAEAATSLDRLANEMQQVIRAYTLQ